MSGPEDVQPLLRDPEIGSDLRSVLDAASDHDPSGADLASLGKRLGALLPPGTLPPAPPPPDAPAAPPSPNAPPVAGAGSSLAGKVIVALAISGAIGTVVWLARSPAAETAPVAAAPSLVTIPPPTPSASGSATVDALASAIPSAAPAPSSTAHAVIPPSPSPSTGPSEPESAMLARAHDALLNGSADRALAIVAEHARAYPRGMLTQEREVIAVEALVSSGRLDQARTRAAAFRAAYPGSSHRARIDRLVESP
jgi:hypothetical protein